MLESKEMTFDLKLKPGECVIFDNRRIVHARGHFNTLTGSRWLAGAYVDTDAVLSRFNVASKKQPDAWRAARVKRNEKATQENVGKEEAGPAGEVSQSEKLGHATA
jgi:hypothetical protein